MAALRASGDGRSAGLRRFWPLGAALAAALLPGAALLLAASCPVPLLASLIDRDPARRVLRAVALFSLAGLIGPAHRLLLLGWDFSAGLQVVLEGGAVRVWAAGGIGWGFSELAALAGLLLTQLTCARSERQLRQRLARLREEWELPEGEGA